MMSLDDEFEQSRIELTETEALRTGLLLITKLILLSLVVFAACEISWRMTGAQPQRSDLLRFAALRRAVKSSSSSVALIGSSRMLCDLDPKVLKRELPKRDFYQLALDGQQGLPVLEDLAQDNTFHGLVMCEFNAAHVMTEYPFSNDEEHLRFSRRRPYLAFVRNWLSESMSQHSALVASSNVDFAASLLKAFRRRFLPTATDHGGSSSSSPDQGAAIPEFEPREDRFLPLHRRGKDNSRAIATWIRMTEVRPAPGKTALQLIPSWVKAIRRRGGDVIFIRLPVSGSLRNIEDQRYPRRDQIIQHLAAAGIPVIDFAKEPTLRMFECPDESHLDADDAERFSAALARVLASRKAPAN